MDNATRVTTWANLVNKLDAISKDSFLLVVQSDGIKQGLKNAKHYLYNVHLTLWNGIDIGWPNTVDLVNTWQPTEPSDPLDERLIPHTLRTIDLMIRSIELDMYAVYVASKSPEAGNV